MKINEVKRIFNENFHGYEHINSTILKLREAGVSQMECVRALVIELGISIKKADSIVINSKAWIDTKEDVEKLRNDIFKTANKLNGST